jgi:hypothetical protein
MLGRPLAKGETLWHVHQPCGASVADTVAWARWFLRQYGDEFPEG